MHIVTTTPLDLEQELKELEAHWKGSKTDLVVARQRLSKRIDAHDIEAALNATWGSSDKPPGVKVIERFNRYFGRLYRWDDSGIVAIAVHFMGDEHDHDYIAPYIALLQLRAGTRPEILDEVYEATPILSKMRLFINGLRAARMYRDKRGSAWTFRAVQYFAANPCFDLNELDNPDTWDARLHQAVKQLRGTLCAAA